MSRMKREAMWRHTVSYWERRVRECWVWASMCALSLVLVLGVGLRHWKDGRHVLAAVHVVLCGAWWWMGSLWSDRLVEALRMRRAARKMAHEEEAKQ